ncbi:MAG: CHAT domain-containing protein [Hormoscilla sp. SP5CHS1]|nr:CHAT domain-containing protein [Hormoscilla sp. SP5CHS1]
MGFMAQRRQHQIVHLATHADFRDRDHSFIQLWDSKLKLEQLRELKWHESPTVELLVLSACRTAIGDEETELGFAGLAVQAGVKSVLASLWLVSDAGTLGLMTKFYQNLLQQPGGLSRRQPIKATALQQAQIAMIRVEVHPGYQKDTLPAELARCLGNEIIDATHPSYWAGFTLIGSPW